MINTIALDDEPPALKVIESFCSRFDFINLQSTFTKPADALRFLVNNKVDLIFLDINMPSQNGIDFYKSIANPNTLVIFTTAYSEYAVEGFNLNALDYLLKPISFDRFELSINKVTDYFKFLKQKEKTNLDYFYIKADYSLIKIQFTDIKYIEGLDDYIKIHLNKAKTIVARKTMKTIVEKLPKEDFARVHRSYIIPIHKIEKVHNKIIHLDNLQIPIGISYEEEFMKRLV